MTRTFKAIRRSINAEVSARNSKPMVQWANERNGARALQYLAALRGEDSPHSVNYGLGALAARNFFWSTAQDGTKRIAAYRGEAIPHWNFVPTLEETDDEQ